MSVAGYLSAGKPELRMPKKGVDDLGVLFEGAVTTGEKTVGAQLSGDAAGRITPGDEVYESVEDYDPVLRAHCRL
jgi:hypothetical protein